MDWLTWQLVGVKDRKLINETIKKATNIEPTSEEIDAVVASSATFFGLLTILDSNDDSVLINILGEIVSLRARIGWTTDSHTVKCEGLHH